MKDIFSIAKNGKTNIQFSRYLLVGVLVIGVDYLSLFVLTEFFQIYYLISAAVAFLLGLVTTYLLSIWWVFHKRSLNSKTLEFSVFVSLGVVGLFLNEVIIWLFTAIFEFHYLISKTFYLFVYLMIFFIRKKLLFS